MKLAWLIIRAIYCAMVGKPMYLLLLDPQTPKTYSYGRDMSAQFIMDGVNAAVRHDVDEAYIRLMLSEDEKNLIAHHSEKLD